MRISDWSSDVCSSDLIDAVLATRGGKSVDGLLAQVEQKKIRLPALKDDIAAVLTALKKRPDAFSRMVAAFDIGKALDLAALVDSSTKGHSSADLMLAYMPRSEEHTSELQSLMRISYAVFCLKKKQN